MTALLEPATDTQRRCSRCQESKPLDQFPKRSGRPIGVESYCKACHVELTAKWKKANPERANEINREAQRRWRERHAAEPASAPAERPTVTPSRRQHPRHVGEYPMFAVLMREFRERTGRSRNSLAHEVGVDPSYLTRIEHGDREPPRQYIALAIARALRLAPRERDRLLVAGGYTPVTVGDWDDALAAVAEVLADPLRSEAERAAFRETITAVARHWGCDGRR